MNEFDKNFYRIVGRKLRELRQQKDWTLSDIANKVSLTPKTIQRYETGERRIDAPMLKDIVETLSHDYYMFIKEVQIEQTGNIPNSQKIVSSKKEVDDFINSPEKHTFLDGLMVEGKPLTEEEKQQVIDAMTIALEMVKKRKK